MWTKLDVYRKMLSDDMVLLQSKKLLSARSKRIFSSLHDIDSGAQAATCVRMLHILGPVPRVVDPADEEELEAFQTRAWAWAGRVETGRDAAVEVRQEMELALARSNHQAQLAKAHVHLKVAPLCKGNPDKAAAMVDQEWQLSADESLAVEYSII